MKNTISSASPTRISIQSHNEDLFDFDVETSKIVLVVCGILAALTGIWGIACLLSGIQGCENLIDLCRAWVTAITGSGF